MFLLSLSSCQASHYVRPVILQVCWISAAAYLYIAEDKLHRIAYQILNDVPFNSDDLKNLRQMSSQNVLEDYLNNTK